MFDVPKVSVSAEASWISVKINLYHTVNVLTGISGTGKTHFCSKIANYYEEEALWGNYNGEKVRYELYFYTGEKDSRLPEEDGFYLIILDDNKKSAYSQEMRDYIRHAKKSVFLLISRAMEQTGGFFRDCFSEAVYICSFHQEGEKSVFDIKNLVSGGEKEFGNGHDGKGKFEICVCEGSSGHAEEKLYSLLFERVVCCGGKDNVIKNVRDVLKENDYVYITVDLCAYGARLIELLSHISESGKTVLISDMYCFEKCILDALFRGATNIDAVDMDYVESHNDILTYEQYANRLLCSMRYGMCGKFTKKSFPKAFYSECNECCQEQIFNKCAVYMSRRCDRLKMLLLGEEELKKIVWASVKGSVYV